MIFYIFNQLNLFLVSFNCTKNDYALKFFKHDKLMMRQMMSVKSNDLNWNDGHNNINLILCFIKLY